jgi:UDPglucose--hexose-1-phosphate uridylyltransferase
VLVSAGRDRRPWQGAVEPGPPPAAPRYDPDCYLCPGNTRSGGTRNPDYGDPHGGGTFVFTNDFPALRPDTLPGLETLPRRETPVRRETPHPLLRAEPEAGTCRVVCFSPHHDASLARLPPPAVRAVIDTWARQVAELERTWRWVQVFENRGAAMGASSPHPHGQIWATSSLPDEPAAEDARQAEFLRRHGVPLLVDYAAVEIAAGDRVVATAAHWVAVVPFWAVWPFETLLLPLRPVTRLPDLTGPERDSLAAVLRRLVAGYDALFDHPFPYSMGWHGAPARTDRTAHWQLHAHFYPPLLRSPTVRKFLVGYEMLAGVQRDITPEAAAGRLRARVPDGSP